MSATRVVLVTGASSGLGLHCVQSLVSKHENTTVLLACRNLAAAMQTVASIVAATSCDARRLIVLPDPCDLADLNSVRAYAVAVKRWLDGRRIAALVNNAGVSCFSFCNIYVFEVPL
jgi:NAD(P)-dependent dehydrogenase (short-subunit alcohol dehydrogenase family)